MQRPPGWRAGTRLPQEPLRLPCCLPAQHKRARLLPRGWWLGGGRGGEGVLACAPGLRLAQLYTNADIRVVRSCFPAPHSSVAANSPEASSQRRHAPTPSEAFAEPWQATSADSPLPEDQRALQGRARGQKHPDFPLGEAPGVTGRASRGACVPCASTGLPDTCFCHAAQADGSHAGPAARGGRGALSAPVLRPPDPRRVVMEAFLRKRGTADGKRAGPAVKLLGKNCSYLPQGSATKQDPGS